MIKNKSWVANISKILYTHFTSAKYFFSPTFPAASMSVPMRLHRNKKVTKHLIWMTQATIISHATTVFPVSWSSCLASGKKKLPHTCHKDFIANSSKGKLKPLDWRKTLCFDTWKLSPVSCHFTSSPLTCFYNSAWQIQFTGEDSEMHTHTYLSSQLIMHIKPGDGGSCYKNL